MGGLAALAVEAGHKVTGCDTGVYPPMSDQLRALGIELMEGYGADQLALSPDVFVVGNVVSRAHIDGLPKYPLMEAIRRQGQLICAITFDQLNAQRAQLVAHGWVHAGVAASDFVARLHRQRSQAAHKSAANSEDMYVHGAHFRSAAWFLDQHFRHRKH